VDDCAAVKRNDAAIMESEPFGKQGKVSLTTRDEKALAKQQLDEALEEARVADKRVCETEELASKLMSQAEEVVVREAAVVKLQAAERGRSARQQQAKANILCSEDVSLARRYGLPEGRVSPQAMLFSRSVARMSSQPMRSLFNNKETPAPEMEELVVAGGNVSLVFLEEPMPEGSASASSSVMRQMLSDLNASGSASPRRAFDAAPAVPESSTPPAHTIATEALVVTAEAAGGDDEHLANVASLPASPRGTVVVDHRSPAASVQQQGLPPALIVGGLPIARPLGQPKAKGQAPHRVVTTATTMPSAPVE